MARAGVSNLTVSKNNKEKNTHTNPQHRNDNILVRC